jgi:hypothetical protein
MTSPEIAPQACETVRTRRASRFCWHGEALLDCRHYQDDWCIARVCPPRPTLEVFERRTGGDGRVRFPMHANSLRAARPAHRRLPVRSATPSRTRYACCTTPLAASRKGATAAISLLPRPRGRSVARCFGIISGISGRPADTTQIGRRLPRAQATSMPT